MSILQAQGIHHITLNGAARQISLDFWHGILGMRLIIEQPNLDDSNINHLFFETGDGSTLTVFTDEQRKPADSDMPQPVGSLHHIAFKVSMASIRVARARLKAAGFANSGVVDRGFMDSLYFREPLGLLIELACYKFTPPEGKSHGQVLNIAQIIRVKRGAEAIEEQDVADALIELTTKN